MMKLEITQILQDRTSQTTTVFFKGCPLRCPWCDRPEVRKPKKELLYDVESCIDCMVCFPECSLDAHDFINGQHVVDRYKCVGCMACADACPAGALKAASRSMAPEAIVQQCQNTLVLGGGEPLVQHESALQLLQQAKAAGIHTCLETTGAFYPSQIPAILPYVDQFIFRIMDTDPVRMKQNTGGKLEVLLSNLRQVDLLGGKTVLRCKLIPGVNIDSVHACALAELYHSLSNCLGIEPDPHQTTNPGKWKQLDLTPGQFLPAAQGQVADFVALLKDKAVSIIE